MSENDKILLEIFDTIEQNKIRFFKTEKMGWEIDDDVEWTDEHSKRLCIELKRGLYISSRNNCIMIWVDIIHQMNPFWPDNCHRPHGEYPDLYITERGQQFREEVMNDETKLTASDRPIVYYDYSEGKTTQLALGNDAPVTQKSSFKISNTVRYIVVGLTLAVGITLTHFVFHWF